MRTKKRGWLGRSIGLLLVVVLASSALIAACGDDDDDDTAATTEAPVATAVVATTADDDADDDDDDAAEADDDADDTAAAAAEADDDDETVAAADEADDDPLASLQDRGYARTDRLVTTQWIEENLDNDSVILIDLRGEDAYAASHIPGAIRLQAGGSFQKEIEGVPGLIPPPEDIAAVLGSIGATPDHTLVFYDARGSIWASRALWVLAVYGHSDARLLDGDFPLWEAEGRATGTDVPSPTAADYAFSSAPNEDLIAGWQEVVASIEDPLRRWSATRARRRSTPVVTCARTVAATSPRPSTSTGTAPSARTAGSCPPTSCAPSTTARAWCPTRRSTRSARRPCARPTRGSCSATSSASRA